jgi:RNA polymerase sigma-70 factor (ECF subfamily)
MSPESFGRRVLDSYQTLWCIAAAVCGDRVLADDVMQESAMVGLRKLNQFDPGSNFVAWMGSIVRFVALNQARSARRNPAAATEPDVLQALAIDAPRSQDVAIDQGGEFDADELGFDDRVVESLMRLDEIPRVCLLLRTIRNMPYREIALALDMPEGTAMSHVHRARLALREDLSVACDPRS